MHAQTIARTLSAIVSIPLAVLLVINLAKYNQYGGWSVLLTAWLEINLPMILSWAFAPWIKFLAIGALSFTLGIWADHLLRHNDRVIRAQEKKLYHLGLSLLSLAKYAEQMSNIVSLSQREESKFYSTADAILIPLHNLDFATPDLDKNRDHRVELGIIENYSRSVGKLLISKNFSEAKDISVNITNGHANA